MLEISSMLSQVLILASTLIAQPPVIDGRLDDPCWKDAEFHSDMQLMRTAEDDGQSLKPTAFAVRCDESALYLAVRCAEPEVDEMKTRPDNGAIWSECVEFFFSPGKTTFEFYQFAVSPVTKVTHAEFYSEGGHIRPDPYKPTWRQALAFGDKEWTAELAIPLSALYMTRNKDWKSDWLFNFRRTTRVGSRSGDVYTWSPLVSKGLEPENFRTLGGFPARAAEEDVVVRSAHANMKCRTKEGLTGLLDLVVFVGRTGEYEVSASCCSNTTHIRLTAGENRVSLPCVFKENGRALTHFKVAKRGFERTCERGYPVMVDYRPIKVRLTTPGFRNNFYPGQNTDVVAGEIEVADGGIAHLTLEGPGFETRQASVSGRGNFSFDTKGFGIGDATLTVVSGEELERVRIRNLPKSGHRMAWIENGNIIVDGKPTFRIGLFGVNYNQGRRNYARFQSERKSFMLSEEFGTVSVEPGRLVKGSESSEGMRDGRPSEKVLRAIDRRMAENEEKDFAVYFITDEPECRNVSPVWLKYIYDYIVEKDPYHLVFTDSRAGKTYVDTADIFQTHPYLAAVNCEDGVRRYGVEPCDVGSYVDAFEIVDRRTDKVVGIIPACFAYRWYSTRNDYPTLEEYLCTSWAGIVRGVKAVMPYAAHDMGDRAQLWEGTRYLHESIRALEPYLLHGRRTTLTMSKTTETTLYDLDGECVVVALNFTKDIQCAKFPGVRGRFKEFRGSRTLDVDVGIQLKPFEVFIATTAPCDSGLESYATMSARVVSLEKERQSHDSQLLERHDAVRFVSNMNGPWGKYYKLIDGCREMWAAASANKANPYVEMSFTKFSPVFEKVRVYGFGLKNLKTEILIDGAWKELVPKSVRDEEWMREVDFGKSIRANCLRISFPAGKGDRNEVELYEIELPKSVGGTVGTMKSNVAPRKDRGLVVTYGKNTVLTNSISWSLPVDARPQWAVIDMKKLVPKKVGQYKAWHFRYEPCEREESQLLASLGGEPEEAGIYTIRFYPPPKRTRKVITFSDYGLNVEFGGLSLLDKPANYVEFRHPSGKEKVCLGDEVEVNVSFAVPCEDVAAEFMFAPNPLNSLRPYAVNGSSGVRMHRLNTTGCDWGTKIKIASLQRNVPARCVYLRANALGSEFDRTLFGNSPVAFSAGR